MIGKRQETRSSVNLITVEKTRGIRTKGRNNRVNKRPFPFDNQRSVVKLTAQETTMLKEKEKRKFFFFFYAMISRKILIA